MLVKTWVQALWDIISHITYNQDRKKQEEMAPYIFKVCASGVCIQHELAVLHIGSPVLLQMFPETGDGREVFVFLEI